MRLVGLGASIDPNPTWTAGIRAGRCNRDARAYSRQCFSRRFKEIDEGFLFQPALNETQGGRGLMACCQLSCHSVIVLVGNTPVSFKKPGKNN